MSARLDKYDDVPPDAWVRGTQLFQALAAIDEEIQGHKWYESQKCGHDIGWDRAVVNWTIRYGRRLAKRD